MMERRRTVRTLMVVVTCASILNVLRQPALVSASNDDGFSLDLNAPEIEADGEQVTLAKGASQNFTCKASEPVTWTHYAEQYHWEPPNTKIESFETGDPEKPHGAVLMLTDASVDMVGRYYCVFQSADTQEGEQLDELVADYQASTIYVFVDDPDTPLVPILAPVFQVHQYDSFVIPCKPSHPGVNVELYKDLEGDLIDKVQYSKTQGYLLEFNRLEDGGSYYCQVEGQSEHRIHMEVTINEHYDYEEAVTERLPLPRIESDTNGRIPLGKRIRMVCTVNIQARIQLNMKWNGPTWKGENPQDPRIKIGRLKVAPIAGEMNREWASRELVIEDATAADNGTYICTVEDRNGYQNHRSYKMLVRNSSDDFVVLKEENGMSYINERRRNYTQIVFLYYAYPSDITYRWLYNDMEIIAHNQQDKYEMKLTKTIISLKINHKSVYDTGTYTAEVTAGTATTRLQIPVYVNAKPIVLMAGKFVKPDEKVEILCRAIGYPRPDISFMFTPCLGEPWPFCFKTEAANTSESWDSSLEGSDSGWEPTARTSASGKGETQIAASRVYSHKADKPGLVYCRASNSEGSEIVHADLLVSPLTDAVTLRQVQPKVVITVGDRVVIDCYALVYNHTNTVTFLHNDRELLESDGARKGIYNKELFAWQAQLTIDEVSHEHEGVIYCQAQTTNDTIETRAFTLQVLDPVAPMLLSGKSNESISFNLHDPLQLECDIVGTPDPEIKWLKDGALIQENEYGNRIQLTNTSLIFEYLKQEDLGQFECQAANKMGMITKYWKLDMRTATVPKVVLYAIIIVLLVLILVIVLMSVIYYKKKKEVKTLKEAGIANFEKGNMEGYNPELALDEQADLLPYKSEYEFSKDQLKLGKQLGAGAYGVVLKATAQRIVVTEDETTVAVKMVKKQADNEVLRALISELKIMVHLGQHLNVVNLLGAVTKNVAKRELMIIVEYCRYGNVQNFLLKHRPYFIDQINQETGEIDSSIDKNQLRWSNCGYQYNSQGLKYVNLSFSTNNVNNRHHPLANAPAFYHNHIDSGSTQHQPHYVDPKKHLNSKGYVRHSGLQNMGMVDSCNTEVTAMTSLEGEELNTVNSNEPLWRSNYGMDYKGPARSVNTTDLVCWASQIASGMEYLASRNVLHGDLAARNILLCDDNVVKICDFGLARSMYKTNNYKKKREAMLPFKWLALECLNDNLFSTYSDVWAYGIVLWELFSLGKVPYPGMEANQELYYKLRDGYRMDKPQYSNQDIYDIMLNCWNVKPDSRPSFRDLKSRFNAMLPDEMRDHYLELNEPYLQMNAEKIERGETDYLATLGPPEEPAPTAPNYVNGIILPLPPISELRNEKDYLKMSGTGKSDSDEDQFDFTSFNSERHSPTIRNNLDISPPNGSKRHKKRGLPEEIPMLEGSNRQSTITNGFNSDSETEAISPKPRERTSKHNPEPEYMNVKNAKFGARSTANDVGGNQEAISNPGYVALNMVDEKRK